MNMKSQGCIAKISDVRANYTEKFIWAYDVYDNSGLAQTVPLSGCVVVKINTKKRNTADHELYYDHFKKLKYRPGY